MAGWTGRNGFRRAAGAVLYVFCLVTAWWVFVKGIRTTDPDFEFGGESDVRLSRDVYMVAPRYVKALVILMVVAPALGIAALCGYRWVKRRAAKAPAPRRSPAVATGQSVGVVGTWEWRCAVSTLRAASVGMTVLQLTWLWYLRTEAMRDAGGIDRDTEWNFGQILAVATWLPVLMEFVYFFLFPYRVVAGTDSAMVLSPMSP